MESSTRKTADAHVHFFRFGFCGGYIHMEEEDAEILLYEQIRSVANIQLALVVGYEGKPFAQANNEYIRHLANSREWLTTLAYVSVSPPPSPDLLYDLFESGHRGLSLYITDEEDSAALEGWLPQVWRVAESYKAVISLNANPTSIKGILSVLSRWNGCRFLLSHLGIPGYLAPSLSESDKIRLIDPVLSAAEYGNCYVKISGLYSTSRPRHAFPHSQSWPIIQHLLERFTPRRCLWGSDFSPALNYVSFPQALDIFPLKSLDSLEYQAVMGQNLIDMLG